MRNEERIQHMLIHIDKIETYCRGKSFSDFVSDTMLTEACVFNLSQIGELVHGLDDSFIEAHDTIPWIEIYGLRNRIVHDYDGVNLKLVWEIITGDLSELRKILESCL